MSAIVIKIISILLKQRNKNEGQVTQATRSLTAGWTARVRSRVVEEWRFFFNLCVQNGPDVHSASYKMSTGGFPQV